MQEVISKLINERLDLIEKIQRLRDFVNKYGQLFNNKYVELMNKQRSIMVEYIQVLDDRIKMLKGETDDEES